MSGWGQGTINNSIGWGQGSTNSIGWGSIYADSPTGDTAISAPSFTNVYSLDFDGVDDYVDSNFIIPAISTYTISCWIKKNGVLGSIEGLIGDMNSSGQSKSGRAAIAVWSTGYIYVNMGNGSAYWYDYTSYDLSAYLDNAWHHIALTIDGTALKLYVDGVLKYTYTSTVSAGTIGARPYRIGSSSEGTSGVWGGYIDEVSIFNTTLSSGDITSIYNSGTPQSLDSYSSLISWWRFEEGSGTTAIDSGTGGNDGTLTNGVTYSTDIP